MLRCSLFGLRWGEDTSPLTLSDQRVRLESQGQESSGVWLAIRESFSVSLSFAEFFTELHAAGQHGKSSSPVHQASPQTLPRPPEHWHVHLACRHSALQRPDEELGLLTFFSRLNVVNTPFERKTTRTVVF